MKRLKLFVKANNLLHWKLAPHIWTDNLKFHWKCSVRVFDVLLFGGGISEQNPSQNLKAKPIIKTMITQNAWRTFISGLINCLVVARRVNKGSLEEACTQLIFYFPQIYLRVQAKCKGFLLGWTVRGKLTWKSFWKFVYTQRLEYLVGRYVRYIRLR